MLPLFLASVPPQPVIQPTPIVSSVVVDESVAIPENDLITIAQIAQVSSPENLLTTAPPRPVTLGNISVETTTLSNLESFPPNLSPNYSVTATASSPASLPISPPVLPAATRSAIPAAATTPPQTSAQTPIPNPAQSSAPSNPLPPLIPLSPLSPSSPAIPLPPLIPPRVVMQQHEVRPLPGQLNQVPVLNSNSPEVVFGDGILLSTFPPVGKRSPQAHLNLTLEGRFDVFTHHIARTANQEFARPLYLGVLLYNPGTRVVVVDVMQAAAYFTNPDAPFIQLPDYMDNFSGNFYSGPGSRLSTDILRGVHQQRFPNQIILFPGESRMLMNEPILIGSAVSGLMRLRSNGPVYVASLSMLAPIVPPPPEPPPLEPSSQPVASANGLPRIAPSPNPPAPRRPEYRSPIISEWEDLIRNGSLAAPRDIAPTPPSGSGGTVTYGRVAGVALGNLWQGQLVDPSRQDLSIPERGGAISYVINTLNRGTFGTSQDQSAPIVARYPDTAYRANGNYGIQYSLTLPLYNGTSQLQAVSIALQTPLKRDDSSQGLQFLEPPPNNDAVDVFFRGTVQIAYQDDFGLPRTRAVHVIQRRGQQGEPLVTLRMPPGNRRLVTVDLIYPPDATPPQVLTIRTTNPETTFTNQPESDTQMAIDDSVNNENAASSSSSQPNPLGEVVVAHQGVNLR